MENYNVPVSCQIKDLNRILLHYFGYITEGFFIDVGAYDGVQHSNTWGLAEAGWGGICYEPVVSFYTACLKNHANHPKVKSINTCVGDKEGTITMKVAGTLSTYNEQYANSEYWKNDYANAYPSFAQITTLDKSLRVNNVKQGFEVLSLDVEGAETDVLRFFDVKYWKPKMAMVEAQELHPAKELSAQAPFINKYFADAGYEKIYCDEINSIYTIIEK